jgi:hypothetical protein
MADTAPLLAKPAPNGDVRFLYKQYIGVEVPLKNGKPGRLGKFEIQKLRGREQSNRGRVRSLGPGAIVEPVDFIAVCITQEWKCWICKDTMDVALHGTNPNAISVEHDPAVSVCWEHTLRTVKAAHQRCNHAKAAASDTTRAAKIKRVRSDEEKHAAIMRMKGVETPAAVRRAKIAEKLAKGNRAIQSRNDLSRKEAVLSPDFARASREPGKILSAGFRKPDGYKHRWGKRKMGQ